jgi:hypothetical protein
VFLLVVGLPFRIRSQQTGEPLDRRQEGLFILATLRPAAFVLWASVFAYTAAQPMLSHGLHGLHGSTGGLPRDGSSS